MTRNPQAMVWAPTTLERKRLDAWIGHGHASGRRPLFEAHRS